MHQRMAFKKEITPLPTIPFSAINYSKAAFPLIVTPGARLLAGDQCNPITQLTLVDRQHAVRATHAGLLPPVALVRARA